MNDMEALEKIGALITEARLGMSKSQVKLSGLAGIDIKTLRSVEKAERMPHDVNKNKLEAALGWRRGAIGEVWEDRARLSAEAVTLTDMERGASAATWAEVEADSLHGHVEKASQLKDEELLAELSYRFRNYKVQLNGDS